MIECGAQGGQKLFLCVARVRVVLQMRGRGSVRTEQEGEERRAQEEENKQPVISSPLPLIWPFSKSHLPQRSNPDSHPAL